MPNKNLHPVMDWRSSSPQQNFKNAPYRATFYETSIPQHITTDWERQEDSKIDGLSLRACLAQRKADLQAKS